MEEKNKNHLKTSLTMAILIIVLLGVVVGLLLWKDKQNTEKNEKLNQLEGDKNTISSATQTLITPIKTVTYTTDLNGDGQKEELAVKYYTTEEVKDFSEVKTIEKLEVSITNNGSISKLDFLNEDIPLYGAEVKIVNLSEADKYKELMIKSTESSASPQWNDYIFIKYVENKLSVINVKGNETLPKTINNTDTVKNDKVKHIRSKEELVLNSKYVRATSCSNKIDDFTLNASYELELTNSRLTGSTDFYSGFISTWMGGTINAYTENNLQSEKISLTIEDYNFETKTSSITVEEVQERWLKVKTKTGQNYYIYIDDITDICK